MKQTILHSSWHLLESLVILTWWEGGRVLRLVTKRRGDLNLASSVTKPESKLSPCAEIAIFVSTTAHAHTAAAVMGAKDATFTETFISIANYDFFCSYVMAQSYTAIRLIVRHSLHMSLWLTFRKNNVLNMYCIWFIY